MEKEYCEYVITDGPGTLLDYGVCEDQGDDWSDEDAVTIATEAIWAGHNFHFERCKKDCGTGK